VVLSPSNTSTADSTSITLEEEAYSIVERRLRQRGLDMKLGALVKPYVELDIYGSDGSLTFMGKTKTRLDAACQAPGAEDRGDKGARARAVERQGRQDSLRHVGSSRGLRGMQSPKPMAEHAR
jgi:hypothetical protein